MTAARVDHTVVAPEAGARRQRKRLTLALLWVLAINAAHAEDGEGDRQRATQASAVEEQAQFLAFLEYLGSWEESDEEWQAFHPDEGLSEIRLPAARGPDRSDPRHQAEDDEEQWDDNGRS